MTTPTNTSRRRFNQLAVMLSVGGGALMKSGSVRAAMAEARGAIEPGSWPEMTYRTLGRTGFQASRLIFGCGASLSSQRKDDLLETALEAGINVFDVGTHRYYDDAEKNLAPFLARHRDDIFLISKAGVYLDVDEDEEISVAEAKQAAKTWSTLLDESLAELGVDHVDAYYQMASYNVHVISNEEIYRAFERAKAAGKVSYLGLSSHQNTRDVLSAAIDTGWFDLAMIAITPAGWYDWNNRDILKDTPDMAAIRPLLDRARDAGMGLVGMKAGRFLAGRRWLGRGDAQAFDRLYNRKLLEASLSPFQRSYMYVLEHGLDVVNADLQNYAQLKENFVAAATAHEYFEDRSDLA